MDDRSLFGPGYIGTDNLIASLPSKKYESKTWSSGGQTTVYLILCVNMMLMVYFSDTNIFFQ